MANVFPLNTIDKSIVDPAKSINEYYEQPHFTPKCFRKRCLEYGIGIKGATSKSYLILNGDKIAECRGEKIEKSSDCVLIKHFYEGEEEIYFVELSKGVHKPHKIGSKFQNTYNEIKRAFKEAFKKEDNKSHLSKFKEPPISTFIYIGKTNSRRELQQLKNIYIDTCQYNRPIKVINKDYYSIG